MDGHTFVKIFGSIQKEFGKNSFDFNRKTLPFLIPLNSCYAFANDGVIPKPDNSFCDDEEGFLWIIAPLDLRLATCKVLELPNFFQSF